MIGPVSTTLCKLVQPRRPSRFRGATDASRLPSTGISNVDAHPAASCRRSSAPFAIVALRPIQQSKSGKASIQTAKTLEAPDKLILEILEGSYQFEIPDYQRPLRPDNRSGDGAVRRSGFRDEGCPHFRGQQSPLSRQYHILIKHFRQSRKARDSHPFARRTSTHRCHRR